MFTTGMDNTASDALVQIKLITKQEKYAIPDTPYSVPLNIDTASLNTLLKELIHEQKENIPTNIEFDFIINGELLRAPLNEHLLDKSISTELTVSVEYIERHPSPEPEDCLLLDDWVSAVDIKGQWILAGCYDNTVHLWSAKGKHKLTIPGHTGPVKAVKWAYLDEESGIFVSGSHDQTAILWQWLVKDNAVQCVTVLRGHERSIEAVSVGPDGSKLASSGWDGMVKIWSAKLENSIEKEDGEPVKKRIRSEGGKTRTPLMTLQGHREAVTGITWLDDNTVISASWDHSIRLWDVELGGLKRDIVGNKAFFDVDYSCLNKMLITASADRHARMYDPRSNEGSIIKSTYTSHSQWIQSVRWSDRDEYLFLTGSHDHQMKMWDVRSQKAPLFDLSGHEDKVLCCDWKDDLIVSGGADNTLRIFKQNKMQGKYIEKKH